MTGRGRSGRIASLALVLLCVVLGAIVGVLVAPGRETTWDGEALLRADPAPPTGSTAGQADAATFAAAAAASITAPAVLEVAAQTRPPAPVSDVRASVRPGTAIVEVLATSEDRLAAAAGARTYALALRTVRTASDRGRYRRAAATLRESVARDGRPPDAVVAQLADLETAARSALPLTIVRVGTARERTSGVARPVAALAGAGAGLLVALALLAGARAWRRRGQRIVTLPALRSASGAVPVVGAVPPLRAFARGARGKAFDVTPTEVETFRMLRRGLPEAPAGGGQVVLVTSAQPGAGKSTVAIGLAAAAADAGERVLLIECDLRIPSLAGRLGLRSGPGLADHLSGRAEPRATLQEARLPGAAPTGPSFWVVTAGAAEVRPERFSGPAIAEMLEHVRDGYDVVVLDAPPLIGAVDAGHLVPQADAVALCVRLGRISRPALDAAVDLAVRAAGVEGVGVVATDVDGSRDPAGETTIYGADR